MASDADDDRPVTRRDLVALAELERKSRDEIDETDLQLEVHALTARVLQLEVDRDNMLAQLRMLTELVTRRPER